MENRLCRRFSFILAAAPLAHREEGCRSTGFTTTIHFRHHLLFLEWQCYEVNPLVLEVFHKYCLVSRYLIINLASPHINQYNEALCNLNLNLKQKNLDVKS